LLQIQSLIPINYVSLFTEQNSIFLVLFLVGEAAGKAPLGVIKKEDVNINMTQIRGKADSASSAIHDTRMVKMNFD
jgi:hypothetical protein